jgi:hypothetical protein
MALRISAKAGQVLLPVLHSHKYFYIYLDYTEMHDLNEEVLEKRRIYARNYYHNVVKRVHLEIQNQNMKEKIKYQKNRKATIKRNMLYYRKVKQRILENKDGFGDRFRERQRQRNSEYYARHRGCPSNYYQKFQDMSETNTNT